MFGWLKRLFASAPRPKRAAGAQTSAQLQRLRAIKAKYDAAQTVPGNERHWANADSLSPLVANTLSVRKKLRERSRYEVENNSYAKGIVLTLANNLIGPGPRLQVTTPDVELNRAIEEAYAAWSKAVRLPDQLRTMTMAKKVDGEAFCVLCNNPGLDSPIQLDMKLIECDQVTAPGFLSWSPTSAGPWAWADTDGIILDSHGNVVGYQVLRAHPGDSLGTWGEYDELPARRVLHWFRCDRPGQIRGIPELTPALPQFANLRRFCLATIGSAETASAYSAVLESMFPPDSDDAEGEEWDEVEINHRAMVVVPAGYKMSQFKSEAPATTFEMFVTCILREIARCLNMPYNVAAGDSSKSNFSSARLDHFIYRAALAVERQDCEREVLEPSFAEWLEEAVLVPGYLPDAAQAFVAELPHQWHWPAFEVIDPQSEAAADEKNLANGTTTLARICAERGEDWQEVIRQRAREEAFKVQVQAEIQKEMGVPMPAPAPVPEQPTAEAAGIRAAAPRAALRFNGAKPVELKAEAGADVSAPKPFRMLAYTGGPMSLEGWNHPVVVDLRGLTVPSQRRPILRDHEPKRIVGHSEAIIVGLSTLEVEGLVSGASPDALEVSASAKNGFPWQASIGCIPDEEAEFVASGSSVFVNGMHHSGPLYVARRTTLREISFVPIGADSNSHASVAAKKAMKQKPAKKVEAASVTCKYCDGTGLCEVCGGKGVDSEGNPCPEECLFGECVICDGTGMMHAAAKEPGITAAEQKQCPMCDGDGKCLDCEGTGKDSDGDDCETCGGDALCQTCYGDGTIDAAANDTDTLEGTNMDLDTWIASFMTPEEVAALTTEAKAALEKAHAALQTEKKTPTPAADAEGKGKKGDVEAAKGDPCQYCDGTGLCAECGGLEIDSDRKDCLECLDGECTACDGTGIQAAAQGSGIKGAKEAYSAYCTECGKTWNAYPPLEAESCPFCKATVSSIEYTPIDAAHKKLLITAKNAKGRNPMIRKHRILAQRKQVQAQRRDAAREVGRQNDVRKICAAHPTMEVTVTENGQTVKRGLHEHAIAQGWSAQQAELHVLRASRPSGPFLHVASGAAPVSGQVIEAALAMTGKLSGLEKRFPAQVIDAADKHYRRNIGLQQLFLEAAWQGGYQGRHFDKSAGGMKSILQAAFRPEIRAGFSTISLPGILSNTANKFLLEGFLGVEDTGLQIAAKRSVTDFKEVTSYRLTGNMKFQKVGPAGELKHGDLGEESYTNQAETYGIMLAITRQMLINDDLGALTALPKHLGRGAKLAFNLAFWTEFLDNASFFSSANANYQEGAGTTLSVANLTALELLFYNQVDPDGYPLAIAPKYLLVPNALATLGSQLTRDLEVRDTTASTKYTTGNPHAGKWEVIRSSYLSNAAIPGYSTTAFYLLADPNDVATIEVAYLNGVETPVFEDSDADFETLGVATRAYMDWGVNKQDPRGGCKSKGAA